MTTKSSRSNRSSMRKEREQKTQSCEKSTKSKRSSKRSVVAPTQRSQNSVKTQLTQKTTLGPPDEDKFDKMKREAIKIQRTQITQLTAAKVSKREIGFDKTQWELTKWADEAAKPTDLEPGKGDGPGPLGIAPPKEVSVTQVPGENRQEEGEKGDYLKAMPILSTILNGIELLLALVIIILCIVALVEETTMGGIFVCGNAGLCLISIGFVAFWQIRHSDVAVEETKQGTKYYYVRGLYKKLYLTLHFARIVLNLCSFAICLHYSICNYYDWCKTRFRHDLYIGATVSSVISMVPAIIHLVYVKKGIFAIVTFCRKN